MSNGWLKKLTSRSLQKRLAVAVTAGLLAGAYVPNAFAAGTVYDTEFTGKKEVGSVYEPLWDQYYNGFVFADGSTIQIGTTGDAAIDMPGANGGWDAVTAMANGTLNLEVAKNGAQDRYGIRHLIGAKDGWMANELFVKANKLNIKVASDQKAYGVYVDNAGSGSIPVSHTVGTFDGTGSTNVVGVITGNTGAKGFYVGSGTRLVVTGNVDMNVSSANGTANFETVGVQADSSRDKAEIKIYGNANIKSNGTGVLASGSKSIVELLKGANIAIDKSNPNVNYALASDGGVIKLNKDTMTSPEGNTSVIKGNVGLLGAGGSIEMDINGGQSLLDGVIYKAAGSTGTVNLTLANSAIWNNAAYGTTAADFSGSVVDSFTGGSSGATAGIIKQNDSHNLVFNSYAGHGMIVYEHTGNGSLSTDYAAGNTIIKKAALTGADKAGIVLSTDSNGIDMQNGALVDQVLNTLAGKLIYEGFVQGEDNLQGAVQIASGLTSSSVLRKENIKFDTATGQGTYGSNQTVVDFSSTITGDEAKDTQYVQGGVLKGGVYTFGKASTVTAAQGGPAIDVQKDVKIQSDKTLTLKVSGMPTGKMYAVRQEGQFNSIINVGTLDISMMNVGGSSEGIYVGNKNAGARSELTVNGNVIINDTVSNNSIGLHTSGNSTLNINGDLYVKGNPAAASKARYGYYNNGAIYAGANKNLHIGSIINVNGKAELNGNGVFANGSGSTVNLKGDTTINIDKNNSGGAFAIGTQSGTVNVNMNEAGNAAGTHTVVINGNVGMTAGLSAQGETVKDSIVNIGLANDKSVLNGVIADGTVNDIEGFKGQANLYLSNGATWNNSLHGNIPVNWAGVFEGSRVENLVGGKTDAERGVILQNDRNNVTVNNYSGNSLVIYEHQNKGTQAADYVAGDFIVNKAAAGSGIILSTDSSNINLKDANEVSSVLNALAGKLYYKDFVNGATNLTGKVQIASGLLSSSQALRMKDITFDKVTGQGSYQKPADTVVTQYDTQIVEDNYMGDPQKQYWKDKYVTSGDRNYTFDTNAVISVDSTSKPAAHAFGYGAIHWAGTGNGSIDMTGHKLTLITDSKGSVVQKERAHGMIVESEDLNINNVNGLDITVKNSDYSNGIYVIGMPSQGAWDNGSGNAHLTINNDDKVENAVKVRFENCNQVNSAIFVNKNSGTAVLDIKGLVDLDGGNGGRGIYNHRGTVNIGGGIINSRDSYAVQADGGKTSINATLDVNGDIKAASSNRDVVISGNIGANDETDHGVVNIAFNTNKSSFHGAVHQTQNGEVNLLLANKALWTNELTSQIEGFAGSSVKQLAGGSTAANAGYILQKDSNKLNIDKYSGHTVVMYEHTGDGSLASNYAAGDTVINTAAKDSGIVLSTDSKGIDTTDNALVSKVLNALAGKLFYKDFVNGVNNLTGKVQIASGLTSSSQSVQVGNIKFDAVTGQGSYLQEDKLSFSTPITGDYAADRDYVQAGVMNADSVYTFKEGSNVIVNGTGAASGAVQIAAGKTNVVVNNVNGTLNFNNEQDTYERISGIVQTEGGKLTVSAKDVNVKVINNDSMGAVAGIYLNGKSGNTATELEINANTNINALAGGAAGSTGTAYGIYAKGNSNIVLQGNVTMRDANGSWGVGNGGKSDEFDIGVTASTGILAEKDVNNRSGKITVNGKLDMAVNGSGIVAKGDGSSVTVNGGGIIEINKDATGSFCAVAAQEGGKVDINAGDTPMVIKGNLGLFKEPFSSKEKATTLNINLKGADSKLVGVAQNNYTDKNIGQLNLGLSDGAVWENVQYGKPFEVAWAGIVYKGSDVSNFTGGTSEANRGVILQKDTKDLTIHKYSGHSLVIYEHTNDGTQSSHYTAGNTIIKDAAAGSEITLSTDSKGIDTNNKDTVAAVLNALAGKLFYEEYKNGVNELTGKVQIASGLTSSSQSLNIGDITFDSVTGQGTYVPPKAPEIPQTQVTVDFGQAITGDRNTDEAYVYGGVLKDNGIYEFTKESNVNIDAAKGGAINVKKDVVVKAESATVNLNSKQFGISQQTANKAEITAGQLNIKVNNTDRAEGVHVIGSSKTSNLTVNGNTNINAEGVGYVLGVYTAGNANTVFNGNLSMKGQNGAWAIEGNGTGMGADSAHYSVVGIYAGANYMVKKGGKITVNGDVDLAVNGTGVLANGAGSEVTINGGGTILTNKDAVNPHYAIAAESGTVNMNVTADKLAAGNKQVNISGNVAVLKGAVNPNENCKESVINLGLSTDKSTLDGVIINAFGEKADGSGFTGEVNLFLQNGATWTNEVYGKLPIGTDFTGSKVNNFAGGADAAHEGVVIQKDTDTIDIKNYSGHTKFIYSHTVDSNGVVDFGHLGDAVIHNAAEGSGVTMSTDSTGIDMTNKTVVEDVLNKLAGKLVYMSSTVDKNLTGKVQIASGLLSSSAGLQIGDIQFGTDHRGDYVEGTMTPGINDPKPDPQPENGDYESYMMQGTRASMTDSMLNFRDIAADGFKRNGELRNGAEQGAWARIYGGQSEYANDNIAIDGTYYAVQAGFDKQAGDWTMGVSLDYRDGEGTYVMGSEGEHKTYALGVYGTKDMGAGSYLDLNAKVGKVENDFTAYNEVHRAAEGSYSGTGYSMSAQYGKRIENGSTYFEPQMQFTWTHVDGDDYTVTSQGESMRVEQDAFDSLVGRIGLEAGLATDHGKAFARISLNHEFAGDVDTTYVGAYETKFTNYDVSDTWSELTIGGSYKLSKCSNFHADVTKALTGDYKQDWKVNAGFSFNF